MAETMAHVPLGTVGAEATPDAGALASEQILAAELRDLLGVAEASLRAAIRTHPLRTLGLTLGVGWMIGRLLRG